jgi:hypothetical protein
MSEIADKVDALLAEAQEQNEWGGGEDRDGALHPGSVDWESLRAKVRALIDGRSQ